MRTKTHLSIVVPGALALAPVISVTAANPSFAEHQLIPVTVTEAVIVEFSSTPKSNSNDRLAHLATLAISQELNRGAKGILSDSEAKSTNPEVKSLYRITAQPLPAAPELRQSDSNSVAPLILKVARSQKAEAIITGWVRDVKFIGDGTKEHPRRAKVTVFVQVIDVVMEDLVNGAIAAGYSAIPVNNARPSDEEMLSQAISGAAGKVAGYLQNYQLPRASVLTCSNKEVVLNCGKQDEMILGTELAVIRDRKVVARIRVTRMDDHKCWAIFLSDKSEVQVGDEARAYFRLPS